MNPAQFTDVAKFLLVNPDARELVAIADERLGCSIIDRYAETEGDYSHYAQVAFLVSCLALARGIERTRGVRPGWCTGPSFGGKAAAVYSGVLSPAEGIWLTVEIARCLDEYFAVEHTDAVTLSFARTPPSRLREISDELEAQGVWHEVSCRVDDDLAMLTLPEDRVDWLAGRLRAAGGMPLYVMRPPMHCAAFAGLARKVDDEVLSALTFADPTVPVVDDHDGTLLTTGEQVRSMLLDGFTRPVDWPSVVASLRGRGVRDLYVCGQDGLFGRVGRTTSAFSVVLVDPRSAMARRRRRPAA